MFGKKKAPIITAKFCTQMENVRMAIEVLTGHHARFVNVDFNTHRGNIQVGSSQWPVLFVPGRDDLIEFEFGFGWGWHTALFEGYEVKVSSNKNPNKRKTVAGELPMQWVGRSALERREEPIFLREAQHYAEIRGLTLAELLKG